jgi:hypothetical protein
MVKSGKPIDLAANEVIHAVFGSDQNTLGISEWRQYLAIGVAILQPFLSSDASIYANQSARLKHLEDIQYRTKALADGFEIQLDRHRGPLARATHAALYSKVAHCFLADGAASGVPEAEKIAAHVSTIELLLDSVRAIKDPREAFSPLYPFVVEYSRLAATLPRNERDELARYLQRLNCAKSLTETAIFITLRMWELGNLEFLHSEVRRYPLLRGSQADAIHKCLGASYLYELSPEKIDGFRELQTAQRGPLKIAAALEVAAEFPKHQRKEIFERLLFNQTFSAWVEQFLQNQIGLNPKEIGSYLAFRAENSATCAPLETLASKDKRSANAVRVLIAGGEPLLSDPSQYARPLAFVSEQPHYATRMLQLWTEAFRREELGKLAALEAAMDSPELNDTHISSLKAALQSSKDSQLVGLEFKGHITQIIKQVRNAKEKPAAQRTNDNSTKQSPFEKLQASLAGHSQISTYLANIEPTDLHLGRALLLVAKSVTTQQRESVFTEIGKAGEPGKEILRTIGQYPWLRERVAALLLEGNLRQFNRILTENTEGNLLGRLVTLVAPNAEEPTQSATLAPLQAPKFMDVAFGAWRGKNKILIAGGEYTGPAAERISNAVPGIQIDILQVVDKGKIHAIASRKHDLVILVTTSISHPISGIVLDYATPQGATIHRFNQRSPGLLIDMLKFGLGILDSE